MSIDPDFIADAWRNICLFVDSLLYSVVSLLYQLFYYVSNAEFLNAEFVQSIYQRISLVLGVFMLFSLAFEFVRMLINPDAMSDKKSGIGNVITRVVVVVLLLGMVNPIFEEAFELQRIILKQDIPGKLITGVSSNEVISNDDFGVNFSKNIFFSFVRDDEEPKLLDARTGMDYENLQSSIKDYSDFGNVSKYINSKSTDSGVYDLEYGYIVSGAVAILVIWILINYVFSSAIRVVQLAFLRLIAPIPIIGYITVKGGDRFKKWTHQCITTYLDLFIRLIIINLAFFFIKVVCQEGAIGGINDALDAVQSFIKVIIIIGILMFAKKAPDLIKELFPSSGAASGDFGLSLKKRFKDNLAGKGLALLGSAATLGAGKLRGGIDARKNGFRFRDGANQVRANNKLRKWLDDTAPYSREQRKKQLEAGSNSFVRDKLIEIGKGNYWKNEGTLTANSFSNQAYRDSWQSVEDAKSAVKTAETEMAVAQSELNAAYSKGDGKDIENATARYEKAQKTLKSANGVLEYRKQRHDDMKKLHSSDARIEDSFDAYKKATSDVEKAMHKQEYEKKKGNSSEVSTAQAPNVTGATGNGVTQNNSSSDNGTSSDDLHILYGNNDDGAE